MAVELGLLDLIEQGPVADAQELGCLNPIPSGLLEGLENRLALRHLRGLPGDVLERNGGNATGARDLVWRPATRCHWEGTSSQVRIAQYDNALDHVLELPHIAREPMSQESLHSLGGECDILPPEEH